MEIEPKIERTPDAKRLDCGSMPSRSQDARRHWLDKHHGESDRRGTGPEDEHQGKATGKSR
jgi:hypothetical protein